MATTLCDLRNRDGGGVLGGMHPADIERDGPTVPREGELGQPLVGPSGNNRLPSRMTGGMVVVASLGTGFGIAAGPDAQVNGVDRLAVSGGVLRQRRPQELEVDATLGQRGVETAPPAAVRASKLR